MKPKLAAFLFLAIVVSAPKLHAQMITGKVLGENGLAASAISVKFMNNVNTVVTNADGTFKIMATKLPDSLVFSAVGYESYKVRVTDKTVKDIKFEVVLLKARHELSNVVVVGYGATKRKDVTGSVAKMEAKEFSEKAPDSKIAEDAVVGRLAGVAVSPGYDADRSVSSSVRIRGTGSVSGSPGLGKTADLNFFSGKKISFNDTVTIGAGEKTYATKLVTAGEVNDFNKWKMWEDFTETDFKQHSQQWNLFPRQRYCIQLQNKTHAPVVGQEVKLVRKTTKELVWTGITDNTGKAELWAGMNTAVFVNDGDYIILVTGKEQQIEHPTLFENGVNRLELNVDCNTNKNVDIAFVVDATGSMGDEIEFLKLELEDVLRKTFDQFSDLDLKAASVFYRDHGDEYLTKHEDFNDDLVKVLNFIKLQKAGGGGDTPEAVESAMNTALDSLSWRPDAGVKLMFLVLDAPPHAGKEAEIFALVQKAAAKGIRVIPVVCSGADKGTEFLMRSIALATNGTYVFLTDNSGVGGKHLKPTTDVFSVELLNNLLQRLIRQMVYMPACASTTQNQVLPFPNLPLNLLKVKISPNPTPGRVVIKTNKALKDIFIADFTGKILMRLTGNGKQDKWEADLGQYPSGTYIVRYITAENEWGAEKVVVVR
ncbi:MAG: carboxypeptidase-like regulatory domain-containing protein [Chitinophagaceae bacterium]